MHCKFRKAIIVGASSGGFAARNFAATHPERTAGLVLLGSPATLAGRPNPFAELKDPIDPGFVKSFAESVLSRPASAEALDSMIAENLKVPARVWLETSNGLLEETFPGELAKIQAPTLIVWGDRDPIITNEDQLALAEAIKGSKLIMHPGSGHMLYWEEPALIAQDIVAFLNETIGTAQKMKQQRQPKANHPQRANRRSFILLKIKKGSSLLWLNKIPRQGTKT